MLKILKKANIYFIFLNLFFLQAYLLKFKIGPYPSNLQEILLGSNLLLSIVLQLQKGIFTKTIRDFFRQSWLLIILSLFTIAASFNSNIIDQTELLRQYKFLFFAGVFLYLFLTNFSNTDEKKTALKIMGIGAITFGLFSVIYNLLGLNVSEDQRIRGPLDSAVYLGYFLAPFMIFFSMEYLQKLSKHNLGIASILLFIMLTTKSMGAIAGSIGVIIAYSYMLYKEKILQNKYLKFGMIFIVMLVLATIFYTKILPTITTQWSSLDERGQIWQTAWYILVEKKNILLGVGPGQFQPHYFKDAIVAINNIPLDLHVLQPHNLLLLFWLNYGLAGLALIIFLMGKVCHNILLNKNLTKESFTLSMNFIALYFILHGQIDTPIFKNDMLILFLLFFTLATSNTENKMEKTSEQSK